MEIVFDIYKSYFMKHLKIFINLTRLSKPIGFLLLFWILYSMFITMFYASMIKARNERRMQNPAMSAALYQRVSLNVDRSSRAVRKFKPLGIILPPRSSNKAIPLTAHDVPRSLRSRALAAGSPNLPVTPLPV